MEKINYLQRRVVFLENELAEAARSGAGSDEEDGSPAMETGFNKFTDYN
jgi:hypothetical protein